VSGAGVQGGRRTALVVALLAFVVTGATTVAAWGSVLERWYLRRPSSDDLGVRQSAIEELTSMHSRAGIRKILESLDASQRSDFILKHRQAIPLVASALKHDSLRMRAESALRLVSQETSEAK
jgi:hypothetical protein